MVRKPIKNMYLRVKPPHGEIVISAPTRMKDAAIASFVHSRRSWILQQQKRVRAAYQNAIERIGGTDSPQTSATQHIEWSESTKQQAAQNIQSQLPQLLDHWGAIIGRGPTHITLRLMTSRWGSCTPATGRIRLNLQLGLMESRYLEYVLVHEMTHLWARGHGEQFQRHMDRYLPDWRQRRRELNRMVLW